MAINFNGLNYSYQNASIGICSPSEHWDVNNQYYVIDSITKYNIPLVQASYPTGSVVDDVHNATEFYSIISFSTYTLASFYNTTNNVVEIWWIRVLGVGFSLYQKVGEKSATSPIDTFTYCFFQTFTTPNGNMSDPVIYIEPPTYEYIDSPIGETLIGFRQKFEHTPSSSIYPSGETCLLQQGGGAGQIPKLGGYVGLDDLTLQPTDSDVSFGGDETGTSDIVPNPTIDPVPHPETPPISVDVSESGMLTLYKPTLAQVKTLASFLWSTDILTQLGKIWRDPLSLIISWGVLPFTPSTGGNRLVKLGGLDTINVTMPVITRQYHEFNCGTIKISQYFGSALDFNPYTKVSIFIPFVGIRELNTDEVMGATLSLKYNIDVLSGSFVATLRVVGGKSGVNAVLYHYSGNCLTSLPITSESMSALIQAGVSVATAPLGSSNIGSAIGSLAISTASNVASSKINVERSGSVTSTSGIMDTTIPYVIIERPIQSLASGYNKFMGYPSNITETLGNLSGFTKIERIISNGLKCTKEEMLEIESLLKEGVYL